MKQIKVLGSGCKKCIKTAELITATAAQLNVAAEVSKDTSAEALLKFGVMATPAVVIDEKLVHSGSVPSEALVQDWLQQ